jgi:hypothetical protein
MPAKSAAYEKGIREGRAMAARSRNPEASEPEEEEEEEEMDMAANHSRKRSAKGAKHTKPAKDGGMYGKKPMDAECGCGRKGKCDGNCGSMRKRSDSLTPLEYLDACELGIQDRSTAYIRARLDAAERLDLKCGKGSISEGEKCTKGAAQKVQPKQPKQRSKARTIASAGAILGGVALNAGATGYGVGKALTGDLAGAGRAFQLAGAGQALTAVGGRGIGLKKESKKLLTTAALTAGAGTFLREGTTGELGKLARRMRQKTKQVRYLRSNAKGRARMAAIRNAPLPQPRMKNGRVADPWNNDSVYASGFSLDSGSFDI